MFVLIICKIYFDNVDTAVADERATFKIEVVIQDHLGLVVTNSKLSLDCPSQEYAKSVFVRLVHATMLMSLGIKPLNSFIGDLRPILVPLYWGSIFENATLIA